MFNMQHGSCQSNILLQFIEETEQTRLDTYIYI